ncbi:MAG TPA: molybdopterin oxidoreductase [Myxococcales bacterium]|nr:molybdopterin oxidoreductase [Myxococcales bacterium]
MDGNDKIHPAARKYWQGVEELRNDPEIASLRDLEFGVPPTMGDGSEVERRDFLKMIGTTFAAVGMTAGCARRPIEKVIPYVNKPEEITPGVRAYYATINSLRPEWGGLLATARDGRPIKVDGNPEYPLSGGGSDAQCQASIIDLYDGDRLRAPAVGGQTTDWKKLDAAVATALAAYKTQGKKLAIVTPTLTGAATKAALQAFMSSYPASRHVSIDAEIGTAIAAAHGYTHGITRVPLYDFHKADLIVSFDADFLGTWIAPTWFSRQYIPGRRVSEEHPTMSFHIQAETNLSLTGASCDERLRILPSQQRDLVMALAGSVAKATGYAGSVPQAKTPFTKEVAAWTKRLMAAKGKGIVISGSTDVAVQAAINLINERLGNYGKAIDVDRGMANYGDGTQAAQLLKDLQSGAVDAVVLWGVNPVYASSQAKTWKAAIQKAKVSVAICDRLDETASLCNIQAASSHYLECWGDAEPTIGMASIQQPLVRPLHDTRGPITTWLTWAGQPQNEREFIAEVWKALIFPRQETVTGTFQKFWDKSLHDGLAQLTPRHVIVGGPAAAPTPSAPPPVATNAAAAAAAVAAPAVPMPEAATPVAAPIKLIDPILAEFRPRLATDAMAIKPAAASTNGAFELALYYSVAVGDGKQANNPFLQELPDPLTKCTWDNLMLISPRAASKAKIELGDVVEVTDGKTTIELPAMLQPGLHDQAVAIALGYGRTKAGRVGNNLGADAWPFATGGVIKVNFKKTGVKAKLGLEQTHPSYEHRNIVRETTLAEWKKNPKAGNPDLEANLMGTDKDGKPDGLPKSVWKPHKFDGKYRWGQVIDLNACTGCGACVVACNIENNIPVVGRSEVHRKRDMHWLRIDRYYSERPEATPKKGDYDWDPVEDDWLGLADNPQVIFQPMMCQHCENAGCETVCPVLATVHTPEGLNAMAYNRCIGTRYCANNCAYKVRRFNWFQYPQGEMADNRDYKLASLALNPDVTVRSRGVMEKCSMCVQRIQAAKSEILRQGKETLKDGDVRSACEDACPTGGIVFGNLNDPDSAVNKARQDPRSYRALEEINTRPSIWYQTRVRHDWDMMPEGGNANVGGHGGHSKGAHGKDSHGKGSHGHQGGDAHHGAGHGKKGG